MTKIEHDFMYLLSDQRKCRVCEGVAESLPTDCPGDKMSASMAREIRGGRMDFLENRWTSVIPKQQIVDGVAEGIPHPPVGSRWAHPSGQQHTVLMMANVETTDPIRFPVIVVYRNQHGRVETRKLAYWYETMISDLGPCRDDPHLIHQNGMPIVHHFLSNDETPADETSEAPYTCQYCGAPSYVDPSDQQCPPDYCHPADHGSPEDAT